MGSIFTSLDRFFENYEKAGYIELSDKSISRFRNISAAMGSFMAISILVLIGIGVKSLALKICVFIFSVSIPFIICEVYFYEVQLGVKKKYWHFFDRVVETPVVKNIFTIQLLLFCVGFTCLVWHLSVVAGVMFIASVVIANYVHMYCISKVQEALDMERNKTNEAVEN